jgi:hypothetical protein
MAQSLDLELSSSQQAKVADNASLSSTGDMTVGGWAKLESLPPNNGDRYTIASKAEDSNSSTDWGLEIVNVSGTLKLNMFVRNTAGSSSTETYGTSAAMTAVTTGVWYHFLGTFNTTGPACKAYLNGTVLTDNSTATAVTTRGDNNTPTHVGCRGTGTFLDGLMADVRIWSRLLTGTEITNLYSTPCTFSDGANLVAKWSLDGVYTDSSGNGNTLTAVNSPVFATDYPYSCSLGVSVTDQLNITESVSRTLVYNVNQSDQLTITESVTKLVTLNRSVSDQLNVTESVTLLNTKNISVSDQLTITESVTKLLTRFINVSDQLTITESTTRLLNPLLASVVDTITLTESVATSGQLFLSISDQLTLTELAQGLVTSFVSVADNVGVSEFVTPETSLFINVSDRFDISESLLVIVPQIRKGLVVMRGNDQMRPVGMGEISNGEMKPANYPPTFGDDTVI